MDEEANNLYVENMTSIKQLSLLDVTQYNLRPYMDSQINHIRPSIKISFINKGIDFIGLPRIFRDNTVESFIPTYFENKEPPIICYKDNCARASWHVSDKVLTAKRIEQCMLSVS